MFNLTTIMNLITRLLISGGSDYNIEEGNNELQLLPGEPNVQRIIIVNDAVEESNETFTLSLEQSQARVNIHPDFSQTVVTIVDDDGR